jgi:plastocyanin
MKTATLFRLCILAGFSLFCVRASAVANHVINLYFYNPANGQFIYFSPSTLSVPKGDTVTFTNADTFVYNHTATSGTSAAAPTGFWDSGTLANGQTFTLDTSTLAAGIYPFFCKVDPGMTGTLTVTGPPPPPLSVSITNPVPSARYLAGVNITLKATASETGGTVTNVQFFSGLTSLANIPTAPYNFTLNSLAAGNYTFTAKAFDNSGATTVSAPVTIYVQTNSTIGSVATVTGTSSGFKLTLNGIAGQTYAIDVSSNLVNWTPLFTNVAPTDVFSITDTTTSGALQRYYRARQNY